MGTDPALYNLITHKSDTVVAVDGFISVTEQ